MEVNTLFFRILISLPLFPAFASSAAVVKSGYWFSGSDFPVADIDSALFTHLFCASADLDPQNSRVSIPASNAQAFSTFSTVVRRRNPAVKTILSIAGDSNDFAAMASRPSSRKKFVDSSIRLATSLGFDGLDLSWIHPSSPSQMADFAQLVTEWRRAIASSENGNPLILTARVFRSPEHESGRYPVQEMAETLDWINVITYDFYSPVSSSPKTGPPAALYNPGNQISADAGIRSWIESGFPAEKIVMGIPLYGYAWKLSDPKRRDGFFSPAAVNGHINHCMA
ncbi:unnamed protein product [Linum tenue]|uniref:GH18 domain-containing protein n=1 Tax=Linum tenue TaxID=586396 RepID=A0AAV0ID64_9ROSI|nr:unnamed protein product [Linum tenue]